MTLTQTTDANRMGKSLRIVISINTSWNIHNFRRTMLAEFLARGHEVVALAPRDEYSAKLEAMGCHFVPIAIDNKGANPIKDLGLAASYRRCLREIKPDVFLGYTIKPNVYGSIAAHTLGIPVINNVSGLGTAFLEGGLLQRIVETLYRTAFRYSKRVFFQNTDDRALFVSRKLVQEKCADLLPGSGIDLLRFTPVPLSQPDDGEIRFLFIGRVLYDKGIGEYVEAARMLQGESHNLRFSILGFMDAQNRTAVDPETMDTWIAEGLIDYLGPTDDVRPHISRAHCVVLPSYREGTPRTLLEAAAMARPIVATNVPGCREVVDNGCNGLLCRVKDTVDLAKCLREIISMTPERRLEMGRAGRRKMEMEFDEQLVITKYLEAISACTSELDHQAE